MSQIWEPRPQSFPDDDKIPFAAQVNGFQNDGRSMDENQNNGNNSDGDVELYEMSDMSESPTLSVRNFKPTPFTNARDSVFIARKRSVNRGSVSEVFGSEPSEQDMSEFDEFNRRNSDSQGTNSGSASPNLYRTNLPEVSFAGVQRGEAERTANIDGYKVKLRRKVGFDEDFIDKARSDSNSTSGTSDRQRQDENDVQFKNEIDTIMFHDIEEDYPPSNSGSISEQIKKWDAFVSLPPEEEDETLSSEWTQVFLKIGKVIAYILTFIVVLVSAVLSKSILLLMTSMIIPNNRIRICNEGVKSIPRVERSQAYAVFIASDGPERIAWIWSILFVLIAPDIMTFFRSIRIVMFKNYNRPDVYTLVWVIFIETLQVIGTLILVYIVLPSMDSTGGAIMSHSLGFIPSLLAVFFLPTKKRKGFTTLLDILTAVIQTASLIAWPLIAYFEEKDHNNFWAVPVAAVLISAGWWENYTSFKTDSSFIRALSDLKREFANTRYYTLLFVSAWKIIIYLAGMVALFYVYEGSDMVLSLFSKFHEAFDNHDIPLVKDRGIKGTTPATNGEDFYQAPELKMPAMASTPLWFMAAQIFITWVCYSFSKFACKICIHVMSFAFPICLVVPTTVSFIFAMCGISITYGKCKLMHVFKPFQYIFWHCDVKDFSENDYFFLYFNYTTILWMVTLLSQIWLSIHIWKRQSERMVATDKLFVRPYYSSAFVEQSLAFNKRRDLNEERDANDEEHEEGEIGVTRSSRLNEMDEYYETSGPMNNIASIYESGMKREIVSLNDDGYSSDRTVRIYACATMWHEDPDEMMQMLKSIMRMDDDQCARKQAQVWLNVDSTLTEYYEFETHIFFDDAFEQGDDEDDENDRAVNKYVKSYVSTVDNAASNVHQCRIKLRSPKRIQTPYGGRLEWTLPGGTKLITHLKDKNKIRHRKRWSQVMYMYYLLGLKLAAEPIKESRKKIRAENTYILALDGDINFRPQAVHLLVDLMIANPKLGAACGRIHPVGSGPMVWYQQFEYAISHWLQKATEHMIGCVLCSPGCFSLFRAKALMSENVMQKYTTTPTEALHYVQYDQGEDRWLCTLLLKQGWRVEYSAASDAYTHCPEGFGEFYIQRRRWAPSTLFNIADLLRDYRHTIRNNENISILYIIYQLGLMLGTILSPGTIFLMLIGSMNTAFGTSNLTSFYINVVPLVFFILICFYLDTKWQIIYSQILSTGYALVMLAVFVSTAIQIKDEGILSPSPFFFTCIMATFLISAILHPQEFLCILPSILYLLTIPSMYLLLTLYSLINLHIVSWGTRESKGKESAKEKEREALEAAARAEAAKKNKKKGLLSWFSRDDRTRESSSSSHWGISCLCCSAPKGEEERVHLVDIKDTLKSFNENMILMKDSMDKSSNIMRRASGIRRPSSFRKSAILNNANQQNLATVVEMESDGLYEMDEEDYEDNEETPLMSTREMEEENKRNEQNRFEQHESGEEKEATWLRDSALRNGPIVHITEEEKEFWEEFIPKYLKPIDEDRDEKERIKLELLELRNRVMFGFGLFNALFILFVFLMQMHQGEFAIQWPVGGHYNRTYNEEKEDFEDIWIPKNVPMSPIGLALLGLFGIILIIQFIGMILHRLGTLSHLLASTELNCCSSKESLTEDKIIDTNAVRIVRELQKLKGLDSLDESKSNRNSYSEQGAFGAPVKKKEYRLDVAFRKRLMSLKDDTRVIGSSTNIAGIRRKSTFHALVTRRDTIIDVRRKSMGAGLLYNSSTNQMLTPVSMSPMTGIRNQTRQANANNPTSGENSPSMTPPPHYNNNLDSIKESSEQIDVLSETLSKDIIQASLSEVFNIDSGGLFVNLAGINDTNIASISLPQSSPNSSPNQERAQSSRSSSSNLVEVEASVHQNESQSHQQLPVASTSGLRVPNMERSSSIDVKSVSNAFSFIDQYSLESPEPQVKGMRSNDTTDAASKDQIGWNIKDETDATPITSSPTLSLRNNINSGNEMTKL